MTRPFLFFAVALFTLAATTPVARSQETPAPQGTPAPEMTAPAPPASLTPMDRAYDGQTHIILAPYVWLPTLKQNVQYTIPTLPHHGGGIIQSSVQVGPSDYAAKISSAAMFSFEARKGALDLFGDYIYTNLSTSTSVSTTISGPLGKVKIPITLATDSRLATSIWELAAGFSIAHGHNADLNVFAGWRQFPLHLTLSYNATIGRKGIVSPSGTVTESALANDVIFGLRGRAFFGDDHWYVPYYVDVGSGAINQTWEAFTGAGYTFSHGQAILLVYRSLNYNAFPANSPVQKLTMAGPLIGYTLQL
jgi:hypothetical protein